MAENVWDLKIVYTSCIVYLLLVIRYIRAIGFVQFSTAQKEWGHLARPPALLDVHPLPSQSPYYFLMHNTGIHNKSVVFLFFSSLSFSQLGSTVVNKKSAIHAVKGI